MSDLAAPHFPVRVLSVPPAASAKLSKWPYALEGQHATRLFQRVGRRIELTEAGLLLQAGFDLLDRDFHVLRHRERYHSRAADALMAVIAGNPPARA